MQFNIDNLYYIVGTKLKVYRKKTNGLFGRGRVKITLIINNKRWHTLAKDNENKNKAKKTVFAFVIIIKKNGEGDWREWGQHVIV